VKRRRRGVIKILGVWKTVLSVKHIQIHTRARAGRSDVLRPEFRGGGGVNFSIKKSEDPNETRRVKTLIYFSF